MTTETTPAANDAATPLDLAIARIAHEVVRAYCQSLGDFSQPEWENAHDWQKRAAIAQVELHMNDPKAGPEAGHTAWLAHKMAEGWRYGMEEDYRAKTSPRMLKFATLSKEDRAKVYIFCGVVQSICREQARL